MAAVVTEPVPGSYGDEFTATSSSAPMPYHDDEERIAYR
jgi:hypothetical protein